MSHCRSPSCLPEPLTDLLLRLVLAGRDSSAPAVMSDGGERRRAARHLDQVPRTACAPTLPHAALRVHLVRFGSDSVLGTAQVAVSEASGCPPRAATAAQAVARSGGGAGGAERGRGAAPARRPAGGRARRLLGPAQPDWAPWRRPSAACSPGRLPAPQAPRAAQLRRRCACRARRTARGERGGRALVVL